MAKKSTTASAADPTPPESLGAVVVQRYKAYGECRELGIHCIPAGYIEVERLSDGSYRIANAESDVPIVADEEPEDEQQQPAEAEQDDDPTEDVSEPEEEPEPEQEAEPEPEVEAEAEPSPAE